MANSLAEGFHPLYTPESDHPDPVPHVKKFLFDLFCVRVDCYNKILWIARLKDQTYISHHLEAEVQD